MNKPRAGKEQARAAGAAALPAIPAPQAPSSEIAPPRKRARPASGDGKVTRAGRARALVVVESPTKARTLKKFLDRRYDVVASMGHVKDLPRSRLGVDVANGFAPRYIVIKGKAPILKELKEAAKQASSVYMATDPDREGEAISWHLSDALRAVNPAIKRIEFHEITKEAVLHALARPRDIDLNLVNAQQARRILDRLVGYKLSPLLWRKVRGGLSAGRVQSVAVRLVVDREKEIEAFVPQEYWSIPAQLRKARQPFIARLVGRDGVRYGAPTDEGATVIRTRDQADAIVASLRGVPFTVGEVRRKDQFRHPSPPFTTSTLQQEANHRLGYSAARTMNVAQQLYEGVDLGAEGTVGLITYMRTDSVRVAESAQREAQEYVKKAFGASYLPDAPRVVALDPQQHFTQPPPRYTEASLVRALEERGIGRPSTYAPTIETIKRRGYVKPINRRLHPTDLGKLVNDLLVEHFGDVMDYDFTAAMEEELDNVEEGRLDWQKVVGDFWTPFEHDLVAAEQKIVQVETPVVEIGEACRQCGRPLVRKFGRFGEFIACSRYPECRYTRPLGIGVPCPRCKVGEVVERRSRRGRGFFGCSTYPACTFTSWDRPTDRLCPRCQTSVLGTHQTTRRTTLRCLDKACGYTEVVPAAADEPRAPAEDRPAP